MDRSNGILVPRPNSAKLNLNLKRSGSGSGNETTSKDLPLYA